MSNGKVTNGVPKSVYIRPLLVRITGSPKGRESHGDGVPVVVCDGESPLHGEGEQVSQISFI